jgi:hypothetical protein
MMFDTTPARRTLEPNCFVASVAHHDTRNGNQDCGGRHDVFDNSVTTPTAARSLSSHRVRRHSGLWVPEILRSPTILIYVGANAVYKPANGTSLERVINTRRR